MASRDYDKSATNSDDSDEPDEEMRDRKKEKAKRKPPPKQVAKRMTPGSKGVKDQKELAQKLKERIAQSMIHKKTF